MNNLLRIAKLILGWVLITIGIILFTLLFITGLIADPLAFAFALLTIPFMWVGCYLIGKKPLHYKLFCFFQKEFKHVNKTRKSTVIWP